MKAQLFQSASVHTQIRLDPRTKLYLLLAVNVIMLNSNTVGTSAYIKALLAVIRFFCCLRAEEETELYALQFFILPPNAGGSFYIIKPPVSPIL